MSQTRAAALNSMDEGGREMLRLVQKMFLATSGSVPRQVVFCGVGVENGSSSIVAKAGRVFAANSFRSICLVDANMMSSRLPALLAVDTGNVPSGSSVREQCFAISDNLWFASIDFLADDRGTLLSPTKLKQRFTELREAFDFVLIDASGADVSGDTSLLGQLADGTVLVIDAESTRKISARKAKETLDSAGVRLLGTVLNDRSFPLPRGLYDRL